MPARPSARSVARHNAFASGMISMTNAELSTRLLDVYERLESHFGHEPHWWPIITDDPPFEMLVGAVLVQQTRWQTVEAAIYRLRERGLMNPAALAEFDTAELALLIRPCAFHTQKAPGLQAICRHLLEYQGGRLESLLAGERHAVRQELLALPRIGKETADTVMLYAGGHPVFIVDAYARRLLSRLDLAPGFDFARAPYDAVQSLVEGALENAKCKMHKMLGQPLSTDETALHFAFCTFLWRFHALIVEACIHHCFATRMRQDAPGLRPTFVDPRKCAAHCLVCSGCPLREICATYRNAEV
jgi:endonuclease III related protein